MNVEQLLSGKGREVISVQPHRTLAEAIRTLSEKRIGAVVVMGADGALVGILSERDIIRALGEQGGAALEKRSLTLDDLEGRDLPAADQRRRTDGDHDHGPLPPCSCGGERPRRRHRLDRRRGEASRRGDRGREPGNARLYRHGVSYGADVMLGQGPGMTI